jgi:hypothetical protein
VSSSSLVIPPRPDKPQHEEKQLDVPLAQRLALTLPEASALSGLKVCALRAAIWNGDLPYVRSGQRGRYLVLRESLEKFLRSREQREAR